jgi:hypothetical protein
MPKTAKNGSSPFLLKKDFEYLLMVLRYRICSILQMIYRLRPEYRTADEKKRWSIRSSEYRRLHQLAATRYLQIRQIPALSGRGSGPSIVSLGPEGARALADYLGVPRSDVRYQPARVDSAYFGAHCLAISEVLLALELAVEQTPGVELTEWVNEAELRARPVVRVKDPRPSSAFAPIQVVLISDAEFVLTLADGSFQGFRLEVDRTGSSSPKRLRAKLRATMANSAQDGRVVLWVVPGDSRADLLASWCQEEAQALKADPSLFWITTQGLIAEDTILREIWHEVGGPQPVGLIPSGPPSFSPTAKPMETELGGSPWKREHLS